MLKSFLSILSVFLVLACGSDDSPGYQEPYIPDDYDPSLLNETREEYCERLRNTPVHLCRLRYMGDEERWSMAFYTYSQMKYEPSIFDNGGFYGTPEEAFQTSSVYLDY